MTKLSHEEKTALHQRIATHYENKDAQTEDSRSMVVVKSNSLIQQTRYELSLQEQRLLLYLISKIKPDDKTLEEIEISIKEFCKIIGYNETQYKRLAKTYNEIKFNVNGKEQQLCKFINDIIHTENSYIIINPNILYGGINREQVEVFGGFCEK